MISDRDRISTRQLNRLRRRILRVYGTARREMQEQLTEFLAKYKALDERKREQLDAGEITEEDYRIWLQNQVFQSDLMHAKLDGITQTCTTAQETAYKLARDEQYNNLFLWRKLGFLRAGTGRRRDVRADPVQHRGGQAAAEGELPHGAQQAHQEREQPHL